MNSDLIKRIRSEGYLPIPEDLTNIYVKLTNSKLTSKIPQSPMGIRYLDNVFQHRFLAKTTGCLSLDEAFNDDLQLLRVIDYVLKSGRDPDQESILRNLHFNIHTPSHFFPDSAAALCNNFAPGGIIYDAFTGWGGRSLGAICTNASLLVSTDTQLKSTMSGIIMASDFSKLSKTRCEFINTDFSNYMDSTDYKFDLIMASPPFLDTENYCDDKNRTTRQWVSDFVIPLANKSKLVLNYNGHIAVHGQDRLNMSVLSLLYTAFTCSGYSLRYEYKYGKKPGQSILIFKI